MNPVVHLELHTGDLGAARETYSRLCGWRAEQVRTSCGDYTALGLAEHPCEHPGLGVAEHLGGGLVECATARPLWLPYARVEEIGAAVTRAERLGARVLLGPREGPAGWRAVVSTLAGGEIAFWQPKARARMGARASGAGRARR
jgi:predicted enzyme related to lactoylglutathione lyase